MSSLDQPDERPDLPADEAQSEPKTEPEADQPEEPAWVRRRRLEAVFGDVLPATTRDERDPAPGDDGESAGEKWLKSQVPPHHGGE